MPQFDLIKIPILQQVAANPHCKENVSHNLFIAISIQSYNTAFVKLYAACISGSLKTIANLSDGRTRRWLRCARYAETGS